MGTVTVVIKVENPQDKRRRPTFVKVEATLHPFPKDSLEKGIKRYKEFKKSEHKKGYESVQLLNYESMWWLYYDYNGSKTGHFNSREKALDWFESAGR